jgi:hypothetical protein
MKLPPPFLTLGLSLGLSLGLILGVLGLGVFLSGCASTEDAENSNDIPWAQPSGWESNKLPAMMPNYGDRQD